MNVKAFPPDVPFVLFMLGHVLLYCYASSRPSGTITLVLIFRIVHPWHLVVTFPLGTLIMYEVSHGMVM